VRLFVRHSPWIPVFIIVTLLGCSRLSEDQIAQEAAAARSPEPFMSFAETPLGNNSSSMAFELDVSDRSVVEKSMAIMCECARLTVERGFKYFYIDEQDQGENGRASFRVTFYKSPPEGIPVLKPMDPGDPTEGPPQDLGN